MDEKNFKTIERVGIMNLVLGIVILATGIASGVMIIVNAASLLRTKSKMLF